MVHIQLYIVNKNNFNYLQKNITTENNNPWFLNTILNYAMARSNLSKCCKGICRDSSVKGSTVKPVVVV